MASRNFRLVLAGNVYHSDALATEVEMAKAIQVHPADDSAAAGAWPQVHELCNMVEARSLACSHTTASFIVGKSTKSVLGTHQA